MAKEILGRANQGKRAGYVIRLVRAKPAPIEPQNLIWTVTYHGDHNQRLLLNHVKSLPELIRYLQHLFFHQLIHSLLLRMLEFL